VDKSRGNGGPIHALRIATSYKMVFAPLARLKDTNPTPGIVRCINSLNVEELLRNHRKALLLALELLSWRNLLLSLPVQSAPPRSRHFHKTHVSSYLHTGIVWEDYEGRLLPVRAKLLICEALLIFSHCTLSTDRVASYNAACHA